MRHHIIAVKCRMGETFNGCAACTMQVSLETLNWCSVWIWYSYGSECAGHSELSHEAYPGIYSIAPCRCNFFCFLRPKKHVFRWNEWVAHLWCNERLLSRDCSHVFCVSSACILPLLIHSATCRNRYSMLAVACTHCIVFIGCLVSFRYFRFSARTAYCHCISSDVCSVIWVPFNSKR